VKILLRIHLYLGLCAGIFLLILGITGAITAFEEDTELWLHRQLHYVRPGGQALSEGELIERVNQELAPARVVFMKAYPQTGRSRVMLMIEGKASVPVTETSIGNWRNWVARKRVAVFVNPYDGSIIGRYTDLPQNQKILAAIHQFHMRLAPDPRSWGAISKFTREVVDYAGLALCLLAPTGVILWWRTRRARIKWSGSWFRVCFDVHNAAGIYAAIFLFAAALTGVVIGFNSVTQAIYTVTGSKQIWHSGGPDSTPVEGGTPIGVDRAVQIAREQIPEAALDGITLPRTPKQSYIVLMRVPEEVTDVVHSSVVVDQFSGRPLQVLNFRKDSLAYRVIRMNRAIHTGDLFGTFGHVVFALSSVVLVAMVATGVVIWWKKLAI